MSVAVDESTDSVEAVHDAFEDDSIEVMPVDNTSLQEVQSLFPLLSGISSEPGITLYCHAKGCTHTDDSAASHAWRDAMASACLDYPKLIDCAMEKFLVCGAFRSRQRVALSPAQYHFAGTWWWFRNDALFSRDWTSIEGAFWGAESYPGVKFSHDESCCLFFDYAGTAHLYSPDYWRRHIGPSFRAWRGRLNQCGLRPLCGNPPLSVLGREVLA